MDIHALIEQLPKAELHLHIEGTFEPELMFAIATRNGIRLPYSSVDELRSAYQFSNLQDFLDIYYAGTSVLLYEADFYDLTMDYLRRAHSNGIVHAEIMFDPQAHISRGVSFEVVLRGIREALRVGGKEYGISSVLIMCFLRHLPAADAMKTLEEALPYKHDILAVGLDSSEKGFPPELFEEVFAKARSYGFLTVAHAGEEGPSENIWGALDLLKVSRIDHGNSSLSDPDLVETLVDLQVPLTVCPLSNLKLKVVTSMAAHPLRKMVDAGLKVTINSDDPAYFGGYLNDNFKAVADELCLSESDIIALINNGFDAAFLSPEMKQRYKLRVMQVAAELLMGN